MERLLSRWPFLSAAEAAAARLRAGAPGLAPIVASQRGTDIDLLALLQQVTGRLLC
jgi:hypothetical protein